MESECGCDGLLTTRPHGRSVVVHAKAGRMCLGGSASGRTIDRMIVDVITGLDLASCSEANRRVLSRPCCDASG
jgi:hypothetical protein